MFLVALIVGCALAAPAPEPNPEPKPHFIAAAPLAYSAFASPYVLPGYVSPYAPVVYRGIGGIGKNNRRIIHLLC